MLEWFDDGQQVLTAMGIDYNYTVTNQPQRQRWMIEERWYREDLDSTILLKVSWAMDAKTACAQAQAWEDAYEQHMGADHTRLRRVAASVRTHRKFRARTGHRLAETTPRQNGE